MRLRADLHIHSCLSPCAELSASPRAIAAAAKERGLDLIALTDHNSALNIPAFAAACRDVGLAALYGIEVTTAEELHALVLFGEPDAAVAAGREIYDRLRSIPHDPDRWGDQAWVDEDENYLGQPDKLLIAGGSDLGLTDLLTFVRERDGLLIPAHVDRPAFSITSQLGFLPPDDFDALEVTRLPCPLDTRDLPLMAHSDAHMPEDIGRRWTLIEAEGTDFTALRRALEAGHTTPVMDDPF